MIQNSMKDKFANVNKCITFVVCKNDPEKKFQFFCSLSIIYSNCSYCHKNTSYNGEYFAEHYWVYQYPYKKWNSGIIDKALSAIEEDPKKYLIIDSNMIQL